MNKQRALKKAIVSIKVSLKDSSPEIWRRAKIPDFYTLGDLHGVIQRILGWQDYHLHEFRIAGRTFGPMHSDPPEAQIDEDKVMLSELQFVVGQKFEYTYDFGDEWNHQIEIENIREPSKHERQIECIDGSGACPPEDSGGIHRYYEILKIFRDRKNPEYQEVREWLGTELDETSFDMDEIAMMLDVFSDKKKRPRQIKK